MSAAISCAKAGHTVTVIEKNDSVGGKLWSHSYNGFTFDCGPSLITLPAVLQHICGAEYAQLDIRPLNKICHYFWRDGTHVTSYASPEKFAENIAHNTGENAQSYHAYFAHTKKMYAHIGPLFLTGDIHGASLLRRKLFWQSLPHLPIRNSMTSMHAYNAHHFRSGKVQQIFDRFATYVGSSPYCTSAIYNIISFIEHGIGAYYTPKGIRHIPRILKQVAEKNGVRFIFKQRVERITPQHSVSNGYIASTPAHAFICDALISNTDILQMNTILPPKKRMSCQKMRHNAQSRDTILPPKKRMSCPIARRSTAAIVYLWGINRVIDRFGLHNIIFADEYALEFEDIFTHHVTPVHPTLYINITSKNSASGASDAPKGMENWFVMLNVPAVAADWSHIAHTWRARIIQKIHTICGTNILPHIIHEKILTPMHFADRSCDEHGSLYGENAHGVFGAFRKHATYSRTHNNIYHCGGTVHPGGGIPLAILSGQIAANQCARSGPVSVVHH